MQKLNMGKLISAGLPMYWYSFISVKHWSIFYNLKTLKPLNLNFLNLINNYWSNQISGFRIKFFENNNLLVLKI